ncbi:MAG: M4 family metallopeptidase [Planctomycetota bacterium]|jgi:Zn-dependent metalloprotease
MIAPALIAALGTAPTAAYGKVTDAHLKTRVSPATGVASFVSSADGKAIDVPLPPGTQQAEALDFFFAHGHLFGLTDPARQLVQDDAVTDRLGHTHATFRQVHEGVPVFAAVLRVHNNARGEFIAANGTFIPDLKVSTTPVLSEDDASRIAITEVSEQLDKPAGLTVSESKLYVFRVNLARGVPGPNHLVYEVEVGNGADVREFVYVDAHKGYLVDQITGICDALYRKVYDGAYDAGSVVWEEGDPPYAGPDVDVAQVIDYSEDTYNLFASATNGAYLSYDGGDAIMESLANTPYMNCPNAAWNGTYTQYCTGVAGDDTIAHEFGHAYTQFTHGLIYQWQSGALNEAYSDIYGEVVDFINGAGTDAPGPHRLDGDCSTFAGIRPLTFTINSPPGIAGTYTAAAAWFNPTPPVTVTADVELVDDGDDEGGAASVTDGCQPLIGFTAGNIALIDRGTCSFDTKANNAIAAGAVGSLVVNYEKQSVYAMPGAGPLASPSGMIWWADGEAIKTELGLGSTVNATIASTASTDVSYRWLHAEDNPAYGSANRDLWNPTCRAHPGKVTDIGFYWCTSGDGGGVHHNSGIPNHAFALLVDGGTYNGETVSGIGLTKAFHIYWRAASVYQVPATGFPDHADFLEASCSDLNGTNLYALSTEVPTGSLSGEMITGTDCDELTKVIAAVEFRTEPTFCGFEPLLDPNAPQQCGDLTAPASILSEDWEGGLGSWTVGTRDEANPATFDTPDWATVGGLPDGRPGMAAFVADIRGLGDCGADTEAGVLYLQSPVIAIPVGIDDVQVAFDHWVATEAGWDGGIISKSVNGDPFVPIPFWNFIFNGYNATLNGGSDNPLAGLDAFTGTDEGRVGGSWGQSQINLAGIAGPGDDIQLRFELGLDGCNGVVGWYVDEIKVYSCAPDCNDNEVPDAEDIANLTSEDCNLNGIPDECPGCADDCECANDQFCDGIETCASEICSDGTDPCSGLVCAEVSDICLAPPDRPTDAKHLVLKHRYVSVDPSVNAPSNVAIKVEVAQMRRCQNAPTRACLTESDCDDVCDDSAGDPPHYMLKCPPNDCSLTDPPSMCVASGPCVDLAPTFDPPLAWVVQEPQLQADGERTAGLSDTVYSQDWSASSLLHVGDCGIVPCVTYHVYACDPADLDMCSEPLEIATQRFPVNARPIAFPLFGDVCGGTAGDPPEVLEPDQYVNVKDLLVTQFTLINYGSATMPQAHPTWVDLHGPGVGIPPQYILNISDLTAVYVFGLSNTLPWVNTQGGLDPGNCP